DVAGLGEDPCEIIGDQRRRVLRLPAIDARRQAQQRAAMRHVGKAEAAIAIGFDRRATGEERLANDDAAGHYLAGSCCAAPPSTGLGVSLRWNRIRIGAAMKIEEKVPMKTPNSMDATNERMTSPPRMNRASSARKVVMDVIVVRASISLSERSSNCPSG